MTGHSVPIGTAVLSPAAASSGPGGWTLGVRGAARWGCGSWQEIDQVGRGISGVVGDVGDVE